MFAQTRGSNAPTRYDLRSRAWNPSRHENRRDAEIALLSGASIIARQSIVSDFPEVRMTNNSGISSPPNELVDVAVIGGGIAGVYASWRLRTAQPSDLLPELKQLAEKNGGRLNVSLFEADHRIGGRLFSKRMPVEGQLPSDDPLAFPTVENSVVELGGMRFLEPDHRRVVRLVCHFGLKKYQREHPTRDPALTNLYYLRGRRFALRDWSRPDFQPPYALDRGERGRDPGSLMIEVALRHVERLETNPETYRRRGFWNLLYDELSSEAYRLIRDAGGYETIVGNWNAADAILFLLADFKPGQKYQKLLTGFMSLPAAIHRAFAKVGDCARTGHRLYRIEAEGKSMFLTFDQNPDELGTAGFESPRRINRREVKVRARHVILAMPRRALELLHPDSAVFDNSDEGQAFQNALQAVIPQPGFKIFAAYREPWWRDANKITAGRSLTDLPIRQCFAWRTAMSDDANQASILMASYNDGSDVQFWKGLIRQSGRYVPRPDDYPPGIALPRHDPDSILAPAAVVEELHDQLRELHGSTEAVGSGISSIIKPYYAVMKDWTVDPFGGGWHFWDIGVDSQRIMRRMRKPFRDLPLHVCGEAWSSQQGWVEGALETADDVLKHFLTGEASFAAL